MTIGEALKQRRDELGIVNKVLAIDMEMEGSNVCAIFRGKRNLTMRTATMLAKFLQVEIVIGPKGPRVEVLK